MFYFNFLWLFYLMVLINGYTISKSDVDEDTPGSLVESLRELEDAREFRPHRRHGAPRRGRDEPGAVSIAHPHKTTAAATQPSRLESFWKKLRHRERAMIRNKHSNRFNTKKQYNDNYYNYNNDHIEINKREITTDFDMKDIYGKDFFKVTKDFFASARNNQIKYFNLTSLEPLSTNNKYSSTPSTLKPTQSQSTSTTLSTTLSTLGKILENKKNNLKTLNLKTTRRSTTLEWIGTAQLEALLENIKARALQILIDQSPTITNLVTNSVNEVTFEADPILHHVEQSVPHTKAAAILTTSNNKRATESTLNFDNTDGTSLKRNRRNPTEDVYTVAASIEELLQDELKKIFKNLKGKMYNKYHKCKDMSTDRTTPMTTHPKPAITTHPKPAITTPMTKTVATKPQVKSPTPHLKNDNAHRRITKAPRKFGNNKKVKTSTTVAPNTFASIDDTNLLGLLEQILVKTNEYNVMRLLTTPCYTQKSKIDMLSKRNIETLADLKLKEQVQGYEDSALMPSDIDYAGDNTPEAVTTTDLGTQATEAISFESISDKISYNDYVNGYKYYLKYQQEQEQDDEKFSPMIRYQAHRHHKVDDIGKFILRKLPPVRVARNIFEEIDMDDQDISTKSEDSWFKKHFYVFLDNNSPRKFHTSETVALKASPTESPANHQLGFGLDKPSRLTLSEPPDSALLAEDSAVDLDQLSKNLETYKNEFTSTTVFTLVKKLMAEKNDLHSQEPSEGSFIIKMISALLGGKDRRALGKDRLWANDADYRPEPRLRRHAKKAKQKQASTAAAPTSPAPAPAAAERKDKFEKMGVVQMIAQPTTVVKVPGKKRSRFKNLMKKLHLAKKEKVNKKTKRHVRKLRFKPLKKLKDMLIGPQHKYHDVVKHKGVTDFDIMTSEIDTFKAIKFNRLPNVEDMRKEIPVINVDLADQDKEYTIKYVDTSRPTTETDTADVPLNVEYSSYKSPASTPTDEVKQMTMSQLEHYLHDYKNSIKGSSTEKLVNTATKKPNSLEKNIMEARKNLQFDDPYAVKHENVQTSTKKIKVEDVNEDKIEVLDEDNEEEIPEVNIGRVSPAEESMDVIRNEVDKIQSKLTMYDTNEIASKSYKPSTDKIQTFTRIMFVPGRIQKIEVIPTERNKKSKIAKTPARQIPEPILEKIDVDSAIESLQSYEHSENANYAPLDKLSLPFMLKRRDSHYSAVKSNHLQNLNKDISRKSLSQYSVSPDHFRELLLWHSDILDVDLLTTTSYVPWVERDPGLQEYTTPNVEVMANEVQDMKRFINHVQPKVDKHKINKKVTNVHSPTKKFSMTPEEFIMTPEPTTLIPESTIGTERIADGPSKLVVLGQARYFAFSKNERSKPDKPRATKNVKQIATAVPVMLYSKKDSSSNWTNLVPPPNVYFNTSPRIRAAMGLWRKSMSEASGKKSTLKPLTPTSKMNRPPEQYFSTPLPMDSRDFEDFLKKSHLDVDSVTAPVSDTDGSLSAEKLRATATKAKEMSAKQVIATVDTINFDKDVLMNALSRLRLSAKNLSRVFDFSDFQLSDDARFRRHSVDAVKVSNAPRNSRKIKKKRKLFGKKVTFTEEFVIPEDNVIEKGNIPNDNYDAKYTSEAIQDESVTLGTPKHNNLLYFYVPAKSTYMVSSLSVLPATKAHTLAEQGPGLHEKLIRHLGIKPKNNPKRVRISYHYDILYDNQSKKAKAREPVRNDERACGGYNISSAEYVTTRSGSQKKSTRGSNRNVNKPSEMKSFLKRFKRKFKRNARELITSTTNPVLSKRDAVPETYTAQNVAAFEIYLDLFKTTPINNNVGSEMNALQVHIALPHDQNLNLKRQLDPIKPVFSAKMSDAVNLEYQVPMLQEKLTMSTETNSYLSPGLYMLVDNLCKSGHVTLKPVLSDLSMLRPRQADSLKITESTTPKCSTQNVDELKKVTLNKDFVAAVNNHLVQLYENFTSLNNKIKGKSPKTDVKDKNDKKRRRRDIWPTLKEMLGGDRVCNCHLKENQTLCPACVATDAIVGELIFEFNNLANFMKDHCTEIQTFYWMNPNGGKKLTDSVHRLDRMLHDYYKRVKGKCQGKTCQALASCLDKRTIRNRRRILIEVGLLPADVHTIANDIANALRHRLPYCQNLKDTGEDFLNVVETCLPGVRYKKSLSKMKDLRRFKSSDKDKINRLVYQKPLKLVLKQSNYKREVTQLEKPLVTDSGEAFWYDYIHRQSTEPPSNELDQKLITETTLNALSHNINELFMLFNNMNLTDLDSLKNPAEGETGERELTTESHNKLKCKKVKKERKNQKKSKKKKPTMIFKFHRKLKAEEPNYATTTTDTQVDINTLLTLPTQKSTSALKVILSNLKDKPSLYVKLDKITAISNYSSNPTTPVEQQEIQMSEFPEVLQNKVETILIEEKSSLMDKLKHIFDNRNVTTVSQNFIYNIRSARASKDELNYIPEKKTVSKTRAIEFMLLPYPDSDLVNEETRTNDYPTYPTSKPIYENDELLKYLTEKSTSKADETKYFTEPVTKQNNISPEVQRIFDAASKITTEHQQISDAISKYETTDLTQTPYPTIIIIDHSSGETTSDDVTFDVMLPYEETSLTTKPITDTKELLLSVLRFERKNIEKELQRVRESRSACVNDTATKEPDKGCFGSKTESINDTTTKEPDKCCFGGKTESINDTTTKEPDKCCLGGKTESINDTTTKEPDKYCLGGKTKSTCINDTTTKEPDKSCFGGKTKSTTTTHKPPHKPSCCFASGNYSAISDLLHALKHRLKGKETTKTTKKAGSDCILVEHGVFGGLRNWVNVTEEPFTTSPLTEAKSSKTQQAAAAPLSNSAKDKHTKASDARPASLVCDLSATLRHARAAQRTLPAHAYETFVKSLTCHCLKVTPEYFVVHWKTRHPNVKSPEKQKINETILNLNWLRNQKEANKHLSTATDIEEKANNKDHTVFDEDGLTMDAGLVDFVVDDEFEKFYKGEHGIYSMENRRRRRQAEGVNLTRELTDLPALQSTSNEVLVMLGDPVTLHCPEDRAVPARWSSEPDALLRKANVKVDGDTVQIGAARETNAGTYICREGDKELKIVIVTVLVLPEFQIISSPLYSIRGDTCSYRDLRAIRSLSSAMSQLVCPDSDCSVNVHAPDCLKDRADGTTLLRTTLSLALAPPAVRCSATCRRDLLTQLVRMAAQDVPKLAAVNVLIAGKKNKTLVPFTGGDSSYVVTRRLRRKGAAHAPRPPPPRRVQLRMSCPRHYRLLRTRKICVADSKSSTHEAGRRGLLTRLPRRYDQWWCSPSCIVSAASVAACACAACAGCALLAHVLAAPERRARCGGWAEPGRRPASPSRVLLARLFKRSLSAFRHTDSQETRSSPRKPAPPPLPPIDFD